MPARTLPCSRTERFATPFQTTWISVDQGALADTPGCRASNYPHRLVLGRAPTSWEAAFRTWRDGHAGKGIRTAYVNLEVAELDLVPPRVPPGLVLETTVTGQFAPSRAGKLRPPAEGYAIRLIDRSEWAALASAAVRINDWAADEGGIQYLDQVIVGRRRQHRAGCLRQWVAVKRATGEVVAMAAVVEGDAESRFQNVQTVAEHRGRGLCSALIAAALADHAERRPDTPLWLNQHPDGPAAGLYGRLGFQAHTTMWSLSCPAPRDEAQILALTAAFEAATLPVDEWHHREHITVAVQILREGDGRVGTAVDRMRADLHRFLDAHGIETTKDRGYHETLTRGWLEVTAAFLRARPTESLQDAVLGATLELGDKLLLLRHWSGECLMSWESRRAWVAPDLAPIQAPEGNPTAMGSSRLER